MSKSEPHPQTQEQLEIDTEPGYRGQPKSPETIDSPSSHDGPWGVWETDITAPERSAIRSALSRNMAERLDDKNGLESGRRWNKREYIREANALRQIAQPAPGVVAIWADCLEE